MDLQTDGLYAQKQINISDINSQKVKPVIALDIDDTIISCSFIKKSAYSFSVKVGSHQRAYIKLRPGLNEFLKEASKMFEIFFFSSSTNSYGNQIVNMIAPSTPTNYRFFRDSCKDIFGYSVKDLSLLNRPINKILLIDDIHGSALLQPDNLIRITPWNGDEEDSVLLDQLLPILKRIKDEENLPTAFKKIIKSEHFGDLISFE